MTKKAPENLDIVKLTNELKNVLRRLDSIEKTVNLLFEDRAILENIVGRITGLEEQEKLSRQHANAVRQDIKSDISMSELKTGATVETAVEEVKDLIEKKKIIHIQKGRPWWKFW
jgi:hypothetical protein